MKPLALLGLTVLVTCAPPPKKRAARPTGINHHIEETFQRLMATKALDKELPPDWKLDQFAAGADTLTLAFIDAAGARHSVRLTIKTAGIVPQGKGQFFSFLVEEKGEPVANVDSLLRAARTVDAMTSIEALVAEPSTPPRPPGLEERLSVTVPSVAITLGAVQVILILAAITIALRRSAAGSGDTSG